MKKDKIIEQKHLIIKYGKQLGIKNMSPATSGNISVRYNENVLITASETALGDLCEDDILNAFDLYLMKRLLVYGEIG